MMDIKYLTCKNCCIECCTNAHQQNLKTPNRLLFMSVCSLTFNDIYLIGLSWDYHSIDGVIRSYDVLNFGQRIIGLSFLIHEIL